MTGHDSSNSNAFKKWQKSLNPLTKERLGDALCRAAEDGDLKRVRWLVEQPENDIDYRDGYAIRHALERGHLDIVELMLDHGANANAFQGSMIETSIRIGEIEILKKLYFQGADAHKRDEYPLRLAAQSGNIAAIEFLLEMGADVWAKSGEAFVDAQTNGNIEAWNVLVQWNKKLEALENRLNVRHSSYQGKRMRELRELDEEFNESAIVVAAKGDKFSAVLKIALEAKRDRLRRSDLLMTDQFGNTVLEILGAHNRLASVFNDKIWAERLDSLREIWHEHVPERYKDQVNYKKVVEKAKQRTNRRQIRKFSGNSSFKLKRR